MAKNANAPFSVRLSAALLAGTFLAVAPMPVGVGPDQAAEAFQRTRDDDDEQRRTRRSQTLSQRVYEAVTEANAKYEEGETGEAYKQINKLQEKAEDLSDYERAFVYVTLANWAYTEDDIDKTIQYFEKVREQAGAPRSFLDQATYNLSMIYLGQDKPAKAVDYMLQYIETQERITSVTPYIILGQAYYQLEDYDKGIVNVEEAISIARGLNQEVRRDWWQLLRAMYFSQDNYEKVADILEIMVVEYNDPSDWRQLSAIYGELERREEQLAALEVAYQQGFLTKGSHLKNLAQFYMFFEVPIKAAWVLEKAFEEEKLERDGDNMELLGRAYLMAQETGKALEPMRQAALEKQESDAWRTLGQVLMGEQEWKRAADALERSIALGGLDNPDQVRMVLGSAYVKFFAFDKAEEVLKEARKNKTYRKRADQWLAHVNEERERAKFIDKYLGTNYVSNQ
ncbi:tetratricopeptide repeat protein [Rhodothalassium salexigens]|uniref:tetratricopeptide repeat protein n=1 Tax=Rhodothalassium salexigens TaxID=1086 RepID=UPI0019142093|nr:hypothetical protein [Rhodothalassium salexigens]MBK5921552.1 hypothetical protein [Rhodothalassium salexigens]